MNQRLFEEQIRKANRKISEDAHSPSAHTRAVTRKFLERIERQMMQEQQQHQESRKRMRGKAEVLENHRSVLKSTAKDLTLPARIGSPKDHIRWLIKEMALYLLFRWQEMEQGQAEGEKTIWMDYRKRRREEETRALKEGIVLPWIEILKSQNINDHLKPVLDFLLSIEVSPVCLNLCKACLGNQMSEPDLVTLGEVMQIACPYLCADEIELRGALGPQGELVQKGFLVQMDRYTHHPDRSITLKETVILAALGLEPSRLIEEDLVRRETPEIDLNKVILPSSMKEEVLGLAHRAFRETDHKNSGSPVTTGITLLFYGPSGTGKTLLAQGVASELKKSLLSFSAETVEAHRHCYEDILPGLFQRAEQEKTIVFIDEADDLFQEGSDASRALLLHLESARGLVIMASNNIQNLDPALERRFTVRYRFRMPDSEARRNLWQVLKPLDVEYAPEVHLQRLADKYPFTGAQIEKCLAMAAALATANHEGNLVLDESLICRCAGEQFSVFLSEGIVKMEPLEDSKEGPESVHLEATSFAVEDSKWISCFRIGWEKINRFFPERSNNGPIVLALGEAMQGKRYANELAHQLGFRLLSSSASDIVDLRQREMQKYMPFVEYNPYEFFFTRLVDNETIFLLEDDDETLVIDTDDKWRPETFKLASAIQKSPAVVVIAGRPRKSIHSLVTSLVDYVRILSPENRDSKKSALAELIDRGYPLYLDAASDLVRCSNGSLRLAALNAYLRAVGKGEQQVSSRDLEACLLQAKNLLGHSAPALFGR